MAGISLSAMIPNPFPGTGETWKLGRQLTFPDWKGAKQLRWKELHIIKFQIWKIKKEAVLDVSLPSPTLVCSKGSTVSLRSRYLQKVPLFPKGPTIS